MQLFQPTRTRAVNVVSEVWVHHACSGLEHQVEGCLINPHSPEISMGDYPSCNHQ